MKASILKYCLYLIFALSAILEIVIMSAFVADLINDNNYIDNHIIAHVRKVPQNLVITSDNPSISGTSLKLKDLVIQYKTKYDIPMKIYTYGFLMLAVGLWLLVIILLIKIVKTLENNNPFILKNVVRIRQIAVLLILLAPLQMFITYGYGLLINTRFYLNGNELGTKINIGFETILVGLIVLVIAEVFRTGVELKQDQDLTI